MDRIRIEGGRKLHGTIPISGAKNATLPLMIASLLTDQTLILDNVPRLADVNILQRILGNHGVDIMVGGKRPGETQYDGQTLHISAARVIDTTAPYELVSRMRASFWVIGPLLARFGEAKVSLPGGCAIGTRPVDFLLMALERLGAKIEIDGGYVIARAAKGLQGGEIVFPKVTVGGTHTALMAASLAQGTTVIENAAREPEIADVAACLNKMGARISGAGTAQIAIDGVAKLDGARHRVLPEFDPIATPGTLRDLRVSGSERHTHSREPPARDHRFRLRGPARQGIHGLQRDHRPVALYRCEMAAKVLRRRPGAHPLRAPSAATAGRCIAGHLDRRRGPCAEPCLDAGQGLPQRLQELYAQLRGHFEEDACWLPRPSGEAPRHLLDHEIGRSKVVIFKSDSHMSQDGPRTAQHRRVAADHHGSAAEARDYDRNRRRHRQAVRSGRCGRESHRAL